MKRYLLPRSFFLFVLFLLFNNFSFGQKKIMDFYFDGGRIMAQEKILEVLIDGTNINTAQAVLTYLKSENSMRLNFVDNNLKPFDEEIENLEAFVVKGKTEIVWRSKKNKKLEVVVMEKAGILFFQWRGEKFRMD